MKKLALLFIISSLIFSVATVEAQQQQRSMYERLLQRSDQPASYIDQLAIPLTDSTAHVGVFFRLDYDLVPFLRKRPNMTPPNPEDEYFATLRIGLEVFEGQLPESRRAARQQATSVFRDNWRDTVWVSNFQQTQSRYDHIQGLIQTELKSADYHYELQLNVGESTQERPSNRRNLSIPKFSEGEHAQFILAESVNINDQSISGTLLNYGNNVLYGQDFDLLVHLPSIIEESDAGLELKLFKFRPDSNTDTESEPTYSTKLNRDQIFKASFVSMQRAEGNLQLNLNRDDEGFSYTHISIPNSEFENARYKMVLSMDGRQKPLAQRNINSQWIDMPVSLYNIDVAIDMMKFIVDANELRRLRSGSSAEKERKFREFWAERNPTPETEYNELMAEYYSRIDHAYRNFSSLQVPGFETDQGRTYILYGPPVNVERRLPPSGPAMEIWEYPNRTLIFEATTGFGDFKLISEL